jgi:uncharacterized protein RhaS with RHS repeats
MHIRKYDEITAQYYLRARFYHPAAGRFLQEDVYRRDGLNLYAYCANNPVVYYDPKKLPKAPGSAVVEATGVLILLCRTVILALSVIGLKNI